MSATLFTVDKKCGCCGLMNDGSQHDLVQCAGCGHWFIIGPGGNPIDLIAGYVKSGSTGGWITDGRYDKAYHYVLCLRLLYKYGLSREQHRALVVARNDYTAAQKAVAETRQRLQESGAYAREWDRLQARKQRCREIIQSATQNRPVAQPALWDAAA